MAGRAARGEGSGDGEEDYALVCPFYPYHSLALVEDWGGKVVGEVRGGRELTLRSIVVDGNSTSRDIPFLLCVRDIAEYRSLRDSISDFKFRHYYLFLYLCLAN
jgi:hypothetical protein